MDAVALQVNPNAGYDTYSKILGMQQSQLGLQAARQQLQTGQYMQAQAQAKAQQDQQAAAEMRRGAQLMADPVGNGLVDQDGNPTADAYQKIKRYMPITGDGQYQKMLEAAKGRVDYANAFSQLTDSQRSSVNSALAGVAADPHARRGDVTARLQTIQDDYKGTAAAPYINKIVKNTADGINTIYKEVGDGPDGAMHPKLQQYILGLSRGSIGNQAITGAGGVAAGSNVNMDLGGVIQPMVQAPPLAGGTLTAAGQPLQKGLAPTQTPEYAGRVAAATTTATAGAQRGASAQETAGRSPSVIQALEKARDLIESDPDILRGKATKTFQDVRGVLAGVFGIDANTTATGNELAKQLAYAGAIRANNLGVGGSDAGRELGIAASPNMTGDAKSLPKLIRQSLALERYNIDYAGTQAGNLSPDERAVRESKFRAIPHVLDVYEASTMRSKAEMDEFLKERHMTRADLAKSTAELKKLGAFKQ